MAGWRRAARRDPVAPRRILEGEVRSRSPSSAGGRVGSAGIRGAAAGVSTRRPARWLADSFDDVAAASTVVDDPPLSALPVVVMGHSAGGHLALWLTATAPPERLAGVVALAPVADLVQAFDQDLGDGAVARLLDGGPLQVPERYAAADPDQLPAPPAPVLIMHGTADPTSPSRAWPRLRFVDTTVWSTGNPLRPLRTRRCRRFRAFQEITNALDATASGQGGPHDVVDDTRRRPRRGRVAASSRPQYVDQRNDPTARPRAASPRSAANVCSTRTA